MKKFLKMSLIWLLVLSMISGIMTGCGGETPDDNSSADSSTDIEDIEDDGGDVGDVWISTGDNNSSTDKNNSTGNSSGNGTSNVLSGTTDKNDFWSKVPKSIKGQTIKMMIWWPMTANEKKVIKTWEEKTGTTVKVENVELDEYYNKLAAKISSNQSPSAAAIMIPKYAQVMANNMFQPISKGNFDLKDKMYDLEAMKLFKRGNDTYGVMIKGSLQTHYIVLRYNKTMFKQKGMKDTPYTLWKAGNWNWDTFLDLAKQMTTKDVYGVAYYNEKLWPMSAGGDFIKQTSKGFEVDITENLKKGYRFSWELKNTHKVALANLPSATGFTGGKYAMWVQESFCLQKSRPENQNTNYEFGSVPIPAPKGQTYKAPISGNAWGFPQKAKNLEATSWFLRYWMDDTFYPEKSLENDEAYDTCNWMAEQPKQLFLGEAVYNYGAAYDFAEFEGELATSENNKLEQRIDSAKGIFESNLKQLMKIYNLS